MRTHVFPRVASRSARCWHTNRMAVTRYLLSRVDVVDSSHWEATDVADDAFSRRRYNDATGFSVFRIVIMTHALPLLPYPFEEILINFIRFLVLYFFPPVNYSER